MVNLSPSERRRQISCASELGHESVLALDLLARLRNSLAGLDLGGLVSDSLELLEPLKGKQHASHWCQLVVSKGLVVPDLNFHHFDFGALS